jgi:hypothetical protein
MLIEAELASGPAPKVAAPVSEDKAKTKPADKKSK